MFVRLSKGTMEKAGACVGKQTFAGVARATTVDYVAQLKNKTSPQYKEMERKAVQQVSGCEEEKSALILREGEKEEEKRKWCKR